jgi:hypothetical protein
MKYEQNENRLNEVHKPRWCPMVVVTVTLTPVEQALETPVVSQSVNNVPAFHGVRSFITVLTTPYPEPVESNSHIRTPGFSKIDIFPCVWRVLSI